MYILSTVHHTFLKMLTTRICLTIESFFSWSSFPLFLCPSCVIRTRYCKEKLDFSHSKGWKSSWLNQCRKVASKHKIRHSFDNTVCVLTVFFKASILLCSSPLSSSLCKSFIFVSCSSDTRFSSLCCSFNCERSLLHSSLKVTKK